MKRISAAVLSVFLSFSLFAQPAACPSVKWTAGQTLVGFEANHHVTETAAVDYDEDGKLDVIGVVDSPNERWLM